MSRIGPPDPGSVALEARRSVADVLWIANTRHGPGGHWFARVTHDTGDHDHLGVASDAVRYLADHRVELPSEPPSADDLASLAAIREMVRGLLDPAAGWTPDVLAILARAAFRIDDAGRLTATDAGWPAFIDDLLPPLLEVVRRQDRLAICGNPVCRLVFIDESRSGTRRWCDDAGCGNRDRVSRHRRRAPAGRGGAGRQTGA
jgi:predicted RNA-binding Zn ribbon-like protein